MSLSRVIICGVCVAAVVSLAAPVQAGYTYSGELSVDDGGLISTGKYGSGTILSWTVTNETNSGLWSYTYTLTVSGNKAPAISHIIVEVSDSDPGPAFTRDDLSSYTSNPSGWIAGTPEIQTYTGGPGNPNMPGSVYGIKFNAAHGSDTKTLTISFESDRAPVWGDFYAKGGSNSAVFNTGFAADDPTIAASDGSYLYHVLVPDSTMTVTVPAPATILLTGLGTGLISWLRRRRMF